MADEKDKQLYPSIPRAADMSLRDHFAGLAMQALLSNYGSDKIGQHADLSYKVADAMLKARK